MSFAANRGQEMSEASGSTPASGAEPPPRHDGRRLAAVLVLVPLIAALTLWAFAWSAARVVPRDLPVGVVGSAQAVAPLRQALERAPGTFQVHRYADMAEARTAIEEREVYGAFVPTEKGARLLTASAAGPVVAQLLEEAAAAQLPPGGTVRTTDIVPAVTADPRGSGLNASVLPLAISGVAAGAVVTFLGLRGIRAVGALIVAAALAGAVASALAGSWLGVLPGNWWAVAGAFGLSVLAVSAAVAGLAALMGPAGIGVGALAAVVLGNSFAGVSSAPELLPEPAGAIGQLLPPGAGGTLLRSVSFFDGNGAGEPLLVLSLWAALGLVAVVAGGLRRKRADD